MTADHAVSMDSSGLVVPLATVSVLLIGISAILLYVRARSSYEQKVLKPRTSLDAEREIVRVMFGTQTGTAEKFAKQLVTQLTDRYGEGVVFKAEDLETYDHAACLGGERMLLYLVATYGDGEPTDNCQQFHEWLEPTADAVFSGDKPEVLSVRIWSHATTPFKVIMVLPLVIAARVRALAAAHAK
jgi:sulfite reductase alpha subunit-like flavoprotein